MPCGPAVRPSSFVSRFLGRCAPFPLQISNPPLVQRHPALLPLNGTPRLASPSKRLAFLPNFADPHPSIACVATPLDNLPLRVLRSMEVIDLSSDGEDIGGEDIIDLSSESEGSIDLWSSDTDDDLDSDGPSNRFHRNQVGKPTTVHEDWFLSDQPASFFRSLENKPAYKVTANSKVQSFSRPGPSNTSVIDMDADGCIDNVESNLFGCDEKAVYEEALKHIGQEKLEEDLPEGVLSISLLKHQRLSLAWMLSKENSSHCAGGILADDQGLGKTISTIAIIQKERAQQSMFMNADSELTDDDEAVVSTDKMDLEAYASLSRASAARITKNVKSQRKKKKKRVRSSASTLLSTSRPAAGTLVVCPASVLKQWASELSAKVTETAKLSVLVYHGGTRTRDPNELAAYDVVVTTYAIVAREVPKGNTVEEQRSIEMYGIFPQSSVGKKIKLSGGKAKKKAKNSDVGPLAMVRWFRVVLDEAHTIKTYQTQMAKACCGLSAKRRWCLSGTPIQNSIDDVYSYFRFLKYEPYCKFSSFCSMLKNTLSRDVNHGYKKLQAVLRIVLLRRKKEMLLDGEPIIKLPPKTVQLSKIDFTQEERAFYLLIEESSRTSFKACNHPFLLNGQHSIDRFIEMVKRLPKKTVTDLIQNLERGAAICSKCRKPPNDAVVASCGHVFCSKCMEHIFKNTKNVSRGENVLTSEDKIVLQCDDEDVLASDENILMSDDEDVLASDENILMSDDEDVLASDENILMSDESDLTSDAENVYAKVCTASHCRKELSPASVFSHHVLKFCIWPKLESEATTSCSAATSKPSSVRERSYVSSKIRTAIDTLNSIIKTPAIKGDDTIGSISSDVSPAKAIVFTQWTSMLDLLEDSLKRNHIEFRRLDGAMSLNIRERAVREFNTDPEVRVIIMSLKAGNLGLNMVSACHVIMIDPWWNPSAEDQAVDRAHRIGQTRPVTVSRLTVKDTVEDRILSLQGDKREMIQSAFGEDESGGNAATRLTAEDLRFLFKV
ncbi:hypothetical protein EJB05_39722, partial [Eragrostis curvula]